MQLVNFKDPQIRYLSFFILWLWVVKSVELALDAHWAEYGIYPREIHGLLGVITGPMIHGDVLHLLSNSIPLLILGSLLILVFSKEARLVFILIYLITGTMIWITARQAYHIGASGIVYGLFGFILVSGFLHRKKNLAFVSLSILILYSGIWQGLFPGEKGVSWESHLIGLITGVLLSFFFKEKQGSLHEADPSNGASSHTGNPEDTFRYTMKD